jgi:beta-glucosidase
MGQRREASRHESVVASLDRATKIRLVSGASFWLTEAVDDARIPAIMLTDGPHGVRKQVGDADHIGLSDSEPATCFPTAVTLASSWDPTLLEEVGAALGSEAQSKSVGVLLGPGLNIKRHPAGGRNFEYFSEDPHLSGKIAAAMVRGVQSRGVAACPKHFAVNNQEHQRMRVDAVVDERTLREVYLAGFEIVVREADPWAVMSAYNLVNGEHAGESEELLTGILREQGASTGWWSAIGTPPPTALRGSAPGWIWRCRAAVGPGTPRSWPLLNQGRSASPTWIGHVAES